MLTAETSRYLIAAKSEATRKAYLDDWKDFAAYCDTVGADCLPAEPDTIANYLADRAGRLQPATLSRRLTTITSLHEQLEPGERPARNPAKSAIVRQTLAGIRRTYGVRQRCKAPLMYGDLKRLCHGGAFHGLRGKRDKALLLLGFAAALRRSELVSVQVKDLGFSTDGLMLFIPRSKSDQIGQGELLPVPYFGDSSACPVRAVQDWLRLTNIQQGAVFRSVNDKCELGQKAMNPASVADIVKKYAEWLGLPPGRYAGHSLRRGMATDAAAHGASLPEIMAATRHKSEKQALRYVEAGRMFADTPLNRLM